MDGSNASLTKFLKISGTRPVIGTPALVLILAWFAVQAHAQGALNFNHPIPGGSVALILDTTDAPRPAAKFGGRRVLVTRHEQHWVALLGLSLDTVPGRYIISVTRNDEAEIREFIVKPHRYPVKRSVEHVRRRDTSTKPVQAPWPDLYEQLFHQTPVWNDATDVDLPFRAPVEGRQSIEFGSRQVTGDDVSKPVNYAEFETESGAPVHSPSGGRVHDLANMDDAGVTVVIDHGMGLLSFIGPTSQVQVAVDDQLSRGQVLGTAGQRDMAPIKVIWLVSLNHALINPMLLVGRH